MWIIKLYFGINMEHLQCTYVSMEIVIAQCIHWQVFVFVFWVNQKANTLDLK